jgi:Reverse transcriptase-like
VDARSASTGRGSHRNLGFPRAGRRLPRLLHVYVATARRLSAAPSVIFVDEAARVVDQIPLDRIAPGGSRRALRGIVYALWKARRLGYRRVAVFTDDPAAVAQINGERHVDPDAVGLYLEARALMHLYKHARIDVGEFVCSEPMAWRPPRTECAVAASS